MSTDYDYEAPKRPSISYPFRHSHPPATRSTSEKPICTYCAHWDGKIRCAADMFDIGARSSCYAFLREIGSDDDAPVQIHPG